MGDSDTPAVRHPVLSVRCDATAKDSLITLLWEAGTTGLEEIGDDELRAFFAAPPAPELTRELELAGALEVTASSVADEDWVGRSRKALKAQLIGPLLVRPPWSRRRPEPGELLLVIDPARAFGTGSHESTRLVLEELFAVPPKGLRVLDVGAGSGILSLACLRLGAAHAVAVDIDKEAVAATCANARRNQLADRIEAVQCGPEGIEGRFPLVLANLTATLLKQTAADLAARVAPGGALIIAGFLERDVPLLGERFAELGLDVGGVRDEREWASLRLVARPCEGAR